MMVMKTYLLLLLLGVVSAFVTVVTSHSADSQKSCEFALFVAKHVSGRFVFGPLPEKSLAMNLQPRLQQKRKSFTVVFGVLL